MPRHYQINNSLTKLKQKTNRIKIYCGVSGESLYTEV